MPEYHWIDWRREFSWWRWGWMGVLGSALLLGFMRWLFNGPYPWRFAVVLITIFLGYWTTMWVMLRRQARRKMDSVLHELTHMEKEPYN